MEQALMSIVEEAGGKLVDPEKEAPAFQWEDDGTEEVAAVLPFVKIVQGVSKMPDAERHIGEFWRSDTGDFYPEMTIVPLFQKTTRALFNRIGDRQVLLAGEDPETLICASADGKEPMPEQLYWHKTGKDQPFSCEMCPFSQWGEDDRGFSVRPTCGESWVILADHDGDLVQIRLARSAMSAWREFLSKRVRPKVLQEDGTRRESRMFQFRVTLRTERRTQNGNTWQALVVEATKMSDLEASIYNAVLAYERQRFVAGLHDATLAAE